MLGFGIAVLAVTLSAPSPPSASGWLARASRAVGLERAQGRVLHYRAMEGTEQSYQSDRTYPPFFSAFETREAWLEPGTGVERTTSRITYPGFEGPSSTLLATESASFMAGDTLPAPVPAPQVHQGTLQLRPLDPWAVLIDWTRDLRVTLEGHRRFRDYDRIVLRRPGRFGIERLLLDAKSGYPVELERSEPHYLWGQVAVSYLYTTWILADGVSYPGAVFRRVDDATEVTRTIGTFELITPDQAPPLEVPAVSQPMPITLPRFLQPANPDTVRIAPDLFLLGNAGYTEAVALAGDTVWMFEATQGAERARQDSVWIGKLFPGRHPIALVVTDLAWPHVGGVRWWVANGATVVSHPIARSFLEQVVARRWSERPDRLEQAHPRPELRFRSVRDSLIAGGGKIALYPIDGIASEGALMGFFPSHRFLWASDYVQTVTEPSQYALEVYRATRRAGVAPALLAAEHLPRTPWDTLVKLVGGMDASGR